MSVPTLEEFLSSEEHWRVRQDRDTKNAFIAFAKLHVEEALKQKIKAIKKMREEDSSYDIDELDSFTYDAYPLKNIK